MGSARGLELSSREDLISLFVLLTVAKLAGLHHRHLSHTEVDRPAAGLRGLEGSRKYFIRKMFPIHCLQEPLDLADPKLVQAIWKPEVFFPNAKEGDFQFVTMPNLLIRIHPDGEILYILR